jgi:hypothetical protein
MPAILGPTTIGKGDFQMTENELLARIEREIEAKIEAELNAKRARERADIAARFRREEAMAHLDKVNAKHPIEDRFGGLGPEGHAARLRQMDAARARAAAHMDEVNSRPVPGSLAHQRSLIPGSEGFKVK